MTNQAGKFGILWRAAIAAVVLVVLYLTSTYNYLLFHSLAEIFSIVVAWGIFLVAWNSRKYLNNNYLLFLGVAYFFVAGFDLVHTLAYKGMDIFVGYDANLPTQLWIAGRYLQSGSLLVAPLFLKRQIRLGLVMPVFAFLSALIFASIFYWKVFPDCYVEGTGLTQFKIISEYIISAILIGSLGLLVLNRDQFDRDVLFMILCSIALTVISELAFTLYFSVYGPANFLGHYFRIIAFYFIYRAIVDRGLQKPYALLSEDLKREQQALSKERNFVSTVLDTPGALVVVLDTSGRIVRFNKACEQLTGYTFAEVAGKPFWDLFIAPDELEGVKAVFTRLISGVFPTRYENKWVAKDGSNRLITWANSALIDDLGEVEFIVGTGIDITDRKRAEEALKLARDQLELRVKSRTAELVETNKQLEWEVIERKRSQEALEERAEELSQTVADLERFTYVASHDLQEPFRNVANCMEILRRRYEDKLGPEAAKLIDYAIDSSLHLKQLIDGLSLYSRVSARGGAFEPTDCQKVFDQAMQGFQAVIQENQAVITHDPLPIVFGDSAQLVQVFENLLANAIKFNQRPPRVYVSARKEEDELVFSVTDNGIGIEPQYFDRIFSIFQRLHRSNDYPGIGVGLAVTKKIIERHGGRIWVESVPGEGTTFFFTIPDRAKKLSVSC